ncbi:hypothetical protein BDB00DRAFT_874942 [Zychaea mexicana]|uniref:uncharacterized protein n=1 Tax=Zychaea mexicana TaxID=64656 RepID=UPI0022FE6494|nr:uncharacterized protein BDB00DRAFT_874942 [Zychaea mexicana]KAI9490769.1 hypothetical protein BDB00DRAFT_874942 [Zychaea mexicana]
MDFVKRQTLNLTVLQRHDPSIIDICDQSPHAVVYKFIQDKNSWDKMGVEGVLFLVKRQTAPTYALFILNRLSMDNFCLYLSDIRDLSLADEFLICQTSEGKACGLWLFEEKDRQRFLDRILQLRKTMDANPVQTQVALPTATAPSSGQVDILKLFEKASITPQQASMPSQEQKTQANNTSDALLLNMLQAGHDGSEQQPPMPPPPPFSHQQQQPPLHPPPPPPPPAQPAAAFFNGYNGFPHGSEEFHDSGFPNTRSQQHLPVPPPPQQLFNPQSSPMQFPSQSLPQQPPAAAPAAAAVIGGAGEPNKSYYPSAVPPHPAATASPQKAASLLQALQGGPPPPAVRQSPRMSDQHRPWPPTGVMYPSPRLGGAANVTPSLMPQSTINLTQPEVDMRFAGDGRPLLSKPEFIQQFLNMVQNDTSFLDTLYERYRNKQAPQPPPLQPPMPMPMPSSSLSSFTNTNNRAMPPYQPM